MSPMTEMLIRWACAAIIAGVALLAVALGEVTKALSSIAKSLKDRA